MGSGGRRPLAGSQAAEPLPSAKRYWAAYFFTSAKVGDGARGRGQEARLQAMDLALLLLSLSLAGLLGFAAHRSSICTVLAVAEVLSTRRAYMLFSFAKTILWVLAISLPLIWLLPGARASGSGWAISVSILAGGFLFGVGAALNGGCAFSTLWKLGDGQLRMLLTLGSFGFQNVHLVRYTDQRSEASLLAGTTLSRELFIGTLNTTVTRNVPIR